MCVEDDHGSPEDLEVHHRAKKDMSVSIIFFPAADIICRTHHMVDTIDEILERSLPRACVANVQSLGLLVAQEVKAIVVVCGERGIGRSQRRQMR
jgi:hypothetical protein